MQTEQEKLRELLVEAVILQICLRFLFGGLVYNMSQGLNSHYFHIIGDGPGMVINPIVGVYIPINMAHMFTCICLVAVSDFSNV